MHKRDWASACPAARQGPVKNGAKNRGIPWILLALLAPAPLHAADAMDGQNLLSAETFPLWSTRRFAGDTQYSWVTATDGGYVRAASEQSASARYYRQPVDLSQTPWLSWRWRLVEPLTGGNERSKDGDDFAARVYVVYASNFWPGSVRSLNYVWSQQEPVGDSWPNPFTEKAIMVPLRKGGPAGVWQPELRNVVEDFRTYFGLEINDLKGVAIMTDTDNSRQKASADYADMRFHRLPPVQP